jgi:DNA-directed RNA polymerase subunit RPC12/RpoP
MPKRPAHIPPVGQYARCHCLRCGNAWEPMRPELRPSACPQCGSRAWWKPPTKPGDRRPSDPPNPKWAERLGAVCKGCGRRMPKQRLQPAVAVSALPLGTTPPPAPPLPLGCAAIVVPAPPPKAAVAPVMPIIPVAQDSPEMHATRRQHYPARPADSLSAELQQELQSPTTNSEDNPWQK